ncbi:MAG: hypothetical protein ABS09_03025 [SAR86 cluster bacterium BACL1 MAG-120619-bin26]|jgi:hypothetical protein|nr:MAG: hypothetical protein ABS09_03025 [SAR86 cluster bacterium BACL1 MAG-120619-bin26]MDP5038145.1 hypothetical protein [SAR86 cluster bacterium]
MKNLSLALNTAGFSCSFVCFFHCVSVILVFAGILNSNMYLIALFEDPTNHAILILSGFSLACLSRLKFIGPSNDARLKDRSVLKVKFRGLKSKRLIGGGLLLGFSFFFADIYAEILVLLGAMTLLSMHSAKLFKRY